MRTERIPAVLETSFWVAAYRAEVAANGLDLFQMVVPHAVEAEIFARPSSFPQREYPYATLFRYLRGHMSDPPVHVPPPLSVFGPGEAEAIALAHHLNVRLLINEWRAAAYAVGLGIDITTVPAVIVALASQGIIGARAAETKLRLIEPITASAIIAEARRALEAM